MESFELIAFDVDGTLTSSKMPLDSEMARLLCDLSLQKKIAATSGASFGQFEKQFLPYLSCGSESLRNLYLLPTNGASLYQYGDDGHSWRAMYDHTLSESEKKEIFEGFEKAFKNTHFKKTEIIYGVLLEDRGSQITFSGLGSTAPLSLKEEWDLERTKRTPIANELRIVLPGYSISIGGTTSIDVTKKGIDKAYGLKSLMKYLNLSKEKVLYVGDALFPGGNDAVVIPVGVTCQPVKNLEETKRLIRSLLLKMA